MRPTLLIAALATLLAAAPAQNPFMDVFESVVKADDVKGMKEVVKKERNSVRNGWAYYEFQYVSAVINSSEPDRLYRANVLDKLAQVALSELRDPSYGERLLWLKALTPEQCGKKNEQQTPILKGCDHFEAAKALKPEDPAYAVEWKTAIDRFTELLAISEAVPDPYDIILANDYLAESHRLQGHIFETAYFYKKANEAGRAAKMSAVLDDFKLPTAVRDFADKNKIRDDLIDISLPLIDAEPAYKEKLAKAMAAVESKPAGAAPGAPGTPGKPGAGGKPVPGGAVPMKANAHAGARIEWVDAHKPKLLEVPTKPFLTPCFKANAMWWFWDLKKIPDKGEDSLSIPGDNVLRYEKGKLLFNPEGPKGNKSAEDKFKVGARPEVQTFKARKYSDGTLGDAYLKIQDGPYEYKLMGFSTKVERSKEVMIRTQGAMAVSTKYNGFDITIYDDSGDCKFSADGKDCIVVTKGKETQVQPLSRYVYLGELLYELEIDPAGQKIKFRPYDGDVVLIKVDYKINTMPAFLVMHGMGDNSSVYFDAMQAKDHPMWVVPGDYQVDSGYINLGGEGDRRETIEITPGGGTAKIFHAKGDALCTLKLGAAADPGFTFFWEATSEKGKGEEVITVNQRIGLRGCFNEGYEHMMSGPARPMLRMKIGKDAPTVSYEKEMRLCDQADYNKSGDALWFPKTVEIKKVGAGDAYIQLEGVYPKLGKVTSEWERVKEKK